MIPKIELMQIKRAISEGEAIGLSSNEILININQIRPPRIEIQEKEYITSEEQREYLKNYRNSRKEDAKIKDKQEVERKKKDKALNRTGFLCNKCGRVNISDPSTNKGSYVKKRNDLRQKIVISNKCPKCQGIIKLFGGYRSDI